MRLLLNGPPGAGKNTQALYLSEKYNIPHISIGNICRNHVDNKTPLGLEITSYLEQSLLIPDKFVFQMLLEEVSKVLDGFVIDGFPRTVEQSIWLSNEFQNNPFFDLLIYIDIDEGEIQKRLSGRLSCVGEGAIESNGN